MKYKKLGVVQGTGFYQDEQGDVKYKKLGVVQGTGFYQDEQGDVWASNSDLSLERHEEVCSTWNKSCIFFHTDDPLEFCRDLKELLLKAVRSCK